MARPYLLKKRGRFWYYRLAGQVTFHSTSTTRRDEAEAEARRAWNETQISAGVPTGPAPTLNEYAAGFFLPGSAWLLRQKGKDRSCGAATARVRQAQLRNHVLPKWGETPLDRINPVQFETWLAGLNLSNQTKNHILYMAKIVTREAYRERVVRSIRSRPRSPWEAAGAGATP